MSGLNFDILQNEEDISDIRGNYIPQSEKPDLLNPAWVAPLQNQVKISGFDLDVSVQGPPGISPEDPDYLPPTPLTSALERGYQYLSNNTPDAGYEVFGLSGDTSGVIFSNTLFPLTISLNVPKSVVTSYQIGAGFPHEAPEDWTVTFYDAEDVEIGVDVRSAETFSTGQIREFSASPSESVSKAVLSVSKIPLSVVRDSIATRVNEAGFIEVVPANTPRFNYDPTTLAPLGLLIEPEAENLIAIADITQWTKTRVAVSATLSVFSNPVYFVKGDGSNGQHNILTPYPTVNYDTYRTLSIYMKNGTNRFA